LGTNTICNDARKIYENHANLCNETLARRTHWETIPSATMQEKSMNIMPKASCSKKPLPLTKTQIPIKIYFYDLFTTTNTISLLIQNGFNDKIIRDKAKH